MTGVGRIGSARIVLDCRWLDKAGAGRATRFVLRGLAAAQASGEWVLWGDERQLAALCWGAASIQHTTDDPGAWIGQRGTLSRPDGDLFCAMHQVRPLTLRMPVVQLLHDTIPLRFARHRTARVAKLAYLRRVARSSRVVVTPSSYSRACVVRDLGVPEDDVVALHYPIDEPLVQRVARRDAADPFVLCIAGRAAPHKNLPNLVDAFRTTEFAKKNGRLVLLAGGDPVRATLGVEVLEHVDESRLDDLLATCRAVVCPSFEEGFGVPVWDARCLGIPVACSDAGALPEVAGAEATLFQPGDVAQIAAAIDRVVAVGASATPDGPAEREFGHAYLELVARALR